MHCVLLSPHQGDPGDGLGLVPHSQPQAGVGDEAGGVGEVGHVGLGPQGRGDLWPEVVRWPGECCRREVEGRGLHGGRPAEMSAQLGVAARHEAVILEAGPSTLTLAQPHSHHVGPD